MLYKAFRNSLRMYALRRAPALRVTRAETWLTVYRSLDSNTGAVVIGARKDPQTSVNFVTLIEHFEY